MNNDISEALKALTSPQALLDGERHVTSTAFGFVPSPEQGSIFESMALGSAGPNIIIQACAGSGKTTTLLKGVVHIPPASAWLKPAITFIAFAKDIVEDIKTKAPPGVQVATGHSFGLRALKASGLIDPVRARSRDFVDGGKCKRLVWNALDRDNPDTSNTIRLVGLGKSRPVMPCDMDVAYFNDIIRAHDLEFEDPRAAAQVARAVITRSTEDLDTIDFDDMLYLPVVLGAKFDPQDYLLVDEAQDTNDIQLEIFTRMLGPRGRLVAVGDEHQAIFAFRGANADSMSKIAARFSCTEFKLSYSFRCSEAVVLEAQKYVR